jgi:hypothetical protein
VFGQTFYHGLVKKYVVLFGTLFNNITINRSDGTSDIAQTMKVPIAYGPKEKFLARVEALDNDEETKAISLPRIGFELSQLTYAPMRKIGTTQKIYSIDNIEGTNVNKTIFNPVPYDLYFELFIIAKSEEDGLKIMEQILPYFTPEFTVSAYFIEEMPDYTLDIPLILQSVTMEDNYDSGFKERRSLVWTIGFMMKGYFLGPVREPKIIKMSTVNLYPSFDANSTPESIVIIPGLTANGEPTSNIAQTIPYSQIDENDNYGYIVTITGVDD